MIALLLIAVFFLVGWFAFVICGLLEINELAVACTVGLSAVVITGIALISRRLDCISRQLKDMKEKQDKQETGTKDA